MITLKKPWDFWFSKKILIFFIWFLYPPPPFQYQNWEVMVHSARSIALLFASFDVVLPVERKKLSWIDWTIEISPCTRWFLLFWFPVRRSHFGVSHPATYCAWRSLTSYGPVVNTCSHFGARVRRSHMQRETARPPPQVSQHFQVWRRASQWVSLRAAGWSN